MKKILLATAIIGILIFTSFATIPSAANKFTLTDKFVEYIKTTTNPYEFGLREDVRFYPYSTPNGRKIGYRQAVTDKKYYSQGWPKEDAQTQLRKDLENTLRELRKYLAKEYPAHHFDSLTRKSQEILLDYAYSEGVKNLKPQFYKTVIKQNWDKLFNTFMYVRWKEKGWPDTIANKAFADRWLYAETRKGPWQRK